MRTIRAMPPEKQSWKVLDAGRSAIQQLQECAHVPNWFITILETRRSPFLEPGFREREREEMAKSEDIELLEAKLRAGTDRLCQLIESLSDEDLAFRVEIAPEWRASLGEVCVFHYRNLWYHVGQVNFIQTLYGDMAMH